MASLFPKDPKGKILLSELTTEVFLKGIKEARRSVGENVENFKFNKKRCKILSETQEVKEDCEGIIYWMSRDCRVQDNWSMLFAQKLARKNKVPLHVCFFAKPVPELYPTLRHYKFLMEGLKEVSKELEELNISFNLINGFANKDLVDIVKENKIGGVVCDFHPLRKPKKWQEEVKNNLPEDVAFVMVDAHNVVPCWIASEKKEIAARTIRSKINKKLDEYLEGYPNVSKHEYKGKLDLGKKTITFDEAISKFDLNREIDVVDWAKPGTTAGLHELRDFIVKRLAIYNSHRNDPTKNACSNLSPWTHFGFISPQRCALEAKNMKNIYKEGVEGFLEESIVRRELSDNYVYYNDKYDKFEGADNWARITLDLHRKDKREYVYTKEQFVKGLTHDEIWNAAQLQLVYEGKIHGYMRMYWCKKILEWTASPEDAIEMGLYLNDYYSLDGNDPNGFVGVMWSICGVHDHGWKEREVFGKIRFMVQYSLARKFDAAAYCARYARNPKKIATKPKPSIKDSKEKKPDIKKYMEKDSKPKVDKPKESNKDKKEKDNKRKDVDTVEEKNKKRKVSEDSSDDMSD